LADLRSFLKELEKSNELIRIKDPISVKFEAAAVLKKLDRGPAVLFEKIKERATPVVANVCGTRERICRALNVRAEELHAKIIDASLHPVRPKLVKDGPVKEILEKPKLTKMPILTHYEKDAGPYITSAIVAATSPDEKTENVSIHRLLVLDDTHLAIRLVPRHLHHLHEMAKKREKPLDVAIAIGLHPAISLAATSSVPMGVSEYDVANSFMCGELKLTRCEHINARAPADAELVLEGQINPNKEVLEGPLPDILGTYDITRKQPVIDLVGVMRRKDFIYQALLPASQEHQMLMGLAREAKIWDAIRHVVPVVGGVNLTPGGCGWFHAIISIKKQSEGDGKNALMAAFAAHPSLKHAIVVDLDIDVFNIEDVEWAIATRFHGDEDLLVIKNVRGSSLDPASDQERELTTKVGVDATRPFHKPAEKFERAKIPENQRVKEVLKKIECELGS
jgi:UbiD family decarboxylase